MQQIHHNPLATVLILANYKPAPSTINSSIGSSCLDMEILATQDATLSNIEVLAHLDALSTERPDGEGGGKGKALKGWEDVRKDTSHYLTHVPVPPLPPSFSTNISTLIRSLLSALQPYSLTKSEVLMILNLRPTDLTMLDCVIEELELRFSEGEMEGLVRALERIFGVGAVGAMEDGAEGNREGTDEGGEGVNEGNGEEEKDRWQGVSEERRRMIEDGG